MWSKIEIKCGGDELSFWPNEMDNETLCLKAKEPGWHLRSTDGLSVKKSKSTQVILTKEQALEMGKRLIAWAETGSLDLECE